jgi:hypothetical protein
MKSARAQFMLAAALLAGCLAGYAFWYRVVAAASAQAAELGAAIDSASVANQKAQESKEAQSLLAEDQVEVGRYFLADADVVPFLEALQGAGSAVGAAVSIVSVGAAPGSSSALAVSLHITGGFGAVARAAGAIEYAPYDLVENAFSIASDGSGAWHADMNLTVGAEHAANAASSTRPAPPALPSAVPAGGAPSVAPL